jgi:7-carboxy-7-deazaguanine synthase
MKTYGIKELFYTLQGEGFHAGTPALFVRFTGCNLWAGTDETRERDAGRHAASCPRWCDTDFVGGEKMTLPALIERARAEAPRHAPLIVFTGGEPMLQLSADLLSRFAVVFPKAKLAVETNGTVPIEGAIKSALHWVCVSPKLPPDRIKVRVGNEIKVVWPDYSPEDYDELSWGFMHRFVSAQADVHSVGVSTLPVAKGAKSTHRLQEAAELVQQLDGWRLTVQTHKLANIR